MARRPSSDRPVLVLLAGCFFFVLARTVIDADLWGHVRFGGDLFRTGDIVRQDVYSYMTGAQPWINHEWLAEAAFWAAWSLVGGTGLVLLKMAVGFTILGLVLAHLMRRGVATLHAGVVILLAYPLLSIGLRTVRPHMFTYLGLLLVLLAIEAAARGRWRWLWGLPPVFAVWANLHGGFLAGIGILGVWAVAEWRPRGGSVPTRTLLATVVLSLLATLLNPWGIGLWGFLLRTATVPRPEISEWSPTPLLSFEGIIYLVLVALTAAALIRRAPPPRAPLILVYAIVALAPLVAVRHLPLFALAALVMAAEPLGVWSRHLVQRRDRSRPAPAWFSAVLIAIALVMAALSIPYLRGPAIDGVGQPFPVRAVALLEASGVSGDLAVYFDWGEFAIWHLAPGIQVSWDGRRETVYSPAAHEANWRFLIGTGDWDELLTEHGTDLALVPTGMPVYNLLLEREPWTVVYEDSLSALFAPAGSIHAAKIRATRVPDLLPGGDGMLFPGGPR